MVPDGSVCVAAELVRSGTATSLETSVRGAPASLSQSTTTPGHPTVEKIDHAADVLERAPALEDVEKPLAQSSRSPRGSGFLRSYCVPDRRGQDALETLRGPLSPG